MSRAKAWDGLDQCERTAYRSFRIILVRLWVAEVAEHAVAHVFRDKPAGLGDLLGAAAVVCADDLAHVLGVEAGRECGGADEIAEHNGELATFGAVARCLLRTGRGPDRRRRCRRERSDRLQQPLSVP